MFLRFRSTYVNLFLKLLEFALITGFRPKLGCRMMMTSFYSVIESEERNHVIAQENAKLISDIEKTQTTLNEIAQEHSHLLYTQARKQNRK